MDSDFQKWLIERGHSDLLNCSSDVLSELRIKFEEEQQQADSQSLSNFAYFVLGLERDQQHKGYFQWLEWLGIRPSEFGDRVFSVHRGLFAVNEEIGVYWFVGDNVCSGWRHETEADWLRNLDELRSKFKPASDDDESRFRQYSAAFGFI